MTRGFWIFVIGSLLAPLISAQAQTYVSVELAAAEQARNDQRVPGNTGTDFSFSDFENGPFPAYRLYVGHRFNERHEFRALYAPFELNLDGQLKTPVSFAGSNFAANTPTEGRYRFNSYRLIYAYHFPNEGDWRYAVGFTGKIRDAEVKLTQGNVSARKTNVGFVPLLHLQAARDLGTDWAFRFDFDGLAAPQGRAFDIALFLERQLPWPNVRAFGGYRTVEGGADNDEVYNSAWVHYATLGVTGRFE